LSLFPDDSSKKTEEIPISEALAKYGVTRFAKTKSTIPIQYTDHCFKSIRSLPQKITNPFKNNPSYMMTPPMTVTSITIIIIVVVLIREMKWSVTNYD
jgi:hypothetical protein